MSDGWPELRLLPAGGNAAWWWKWEIEISPRVNSCIRRLTKRIARDRLEGLIEVVPSYRSLLIYFDPFRLTRSNLIEALRQMLASGDKLDRAGKRRCAVKSTCPCATAANSGRTSNTWRGTTA